MAQADSVPSSTRQLITGESASQSTNLPAVGVKPSDRGYLIRGSAARVIMGADGAPLVRLWREKRAKSSRRTSRIAAGMGPALFPWARISGLSSTRPPPFSCGGCAGTFF
jgi:hypothetical protein